jgi:flagellar hook-length control protein FliK
VNLEAALAPAPTTSAGPAPNAGAPPGSSPPSGAPPFHSTLAEHTARTAQAEGQGKGDSHSSQRERSGASDGAQPQAGLAAASLEAQSAASGEAGEAAAKAAAEAAGSGTLLAGGDSRAARTAGPLLARQQLAGAAERSRARQAGAPGTLSHGATAANGSSVGAKAGGSAGGAKAGDAAADGDAAASTGASQRVEAPLESTLEAGEPSGTSTPGGEATSTAKAAGAEGAKAAAAQPLAPQRGGAVGVPAEASPTREASTSAAGQQEQAGTARTLRLSKGAGTGGIEVARASRSSRSLSAPLGRGASPAGDTLSGGAQAGATDLAAPGSVESELDSLLSPATGAQATTGGAGATAAPVTAAGVGMQDMIESIRATIEIAARQGAAQARIALHPQELGHISIRLSQTGDGLLARVNAETPAAAQALADGHAELHQSLSSLGVTLLRLDIGSFTQSGAGEREQSAGGQGSSAPGEADGSEEAEGAQAPEQTSAPAGLGAGELVDVLA